MTALLYSSVNFDQASGLYNYNYAVQNDLNSGLIQGVDIFVGGFPVAPAGMFVAGPVLPTTVSSPTGWTVFGAVSGGIAASPYNMNGGFYEWYGGSNTPADVQPGQTLTGFSFSSAFAPTLNNGLNDFFLFSSTNGIVAFGNVEVPSGADWAFAVIPPPNPMPQFTPLPGSAWLMGTVLLVGILAHALMGTRKMTEEQLMKVTT